MNCYNIPQHAYRILQHAINWQINNDNKFKKLVIISGLTLKIGPDFSRYFTS